MKKILLFVCFAVIISGAFSQGFSNLQSQLVPPIFGGSPFQDSLWAFDTTNFNVIYRCGPTPSSGGSIIGINSVTVHPCTGEIFVVVKQSAVSGRVLGKFNPATGVVSIIGNLGDNFSSITFLKSGTLLGVTGDGATVPETVYRINPLNASKTVLRTLGNGADGEVIAYNKDDNMVYHWSGNGTVVFEKFDTAGVTVTNIPISGTTSGETFGAVYLGSGTILISNISSTFQKININGAWGSQIGASSPDNIRGLAMINKWIVQNGNDTICANDSSLLTAMGGQAYQWTLNGTPIAGATSSTYYANQSGWYNCQISGDTNFCIAGAGDTALIGKRLLVNSLPIVNITPTSPVYLCNAGDSILLTGSSGGTSQWYMNGSMISGATTNTHYANTPGVYNMTKTNTNGCTDSAAVGTNVMFAPVNTITAAPDACIGDSILLNSEFGSASYEWLFNGSSLITTTEDSIYISNTGDYSVITAYGSCIDTSNVVTSTINPLPIVSITPSPIAYICSAGDSALLTGSSGGTSQWYMNGSAISGATSNTYYASTPGIYNMTKTNMNGCTDSAAVGTSAMFAPVNTITAGADVCIGDSILLSSEFGSASYEWLLNGSSLTTTTEDSIYILSTGNYSVITTYGSCADTSNIVTATINPLPIVSISPSPIAYICSASDSVLLTGSSGGTSQWYMNGSAISGATSNTYYATAIGFYNMTKTNSNGCTDSAVTSTEVTIIDCSGIEETNSNELKIYPNPAANYIQINSDLEVQRIAIIDMTGRVIQSMVVNTLNPVIGLETIIPGIYIINITTQQGILSGRFIKN